MVTMEQAWLLPAIPAVAFVILAFSKFLRIPLPREGDFIGVGASIAIFIIMLMVAVDLFDQLPLYAEELTNNTAGFDWIKIDAIDFVLRVGFHVDQITIVMLICVTFVGMLVNIYSLGYMKGEPRYGWYYAVLALFVASMLTLVVLRPWFFRNPIPDLYFSQSGAWLPGPDDLLPWAGSVAVLATAATLFSLYARRRLRRPESML